MPAWATVVITLGASLVAVVGTLGAALLQIRTARRERAIQAAAERQARAAAILGRVRTLLSDLDPTRVSLNLGESTLEQLDAMERRWAPLRDELSVFAAADDDQRVTDAATDLEIAVSSTISRVGLLVRGALSGQGSIDMFQDAALEQLQAAAHIRIVLDLVRGREDPAEARPAEEQSGDSRGD